MTKYRVFVSGTDHLGWSFLKNVISVANKGGVICGDSVPSLTFPHGITMVLESEEELQSVPGIRYIPVLKMFEVSELDEMEWEEFRSEMRAVGITGKERKVMVEKYKKFLSSLEV